MSDYLYMLESHLRPRQFQAVQELRRMAVDLNLSVFLSGGTLRDVLGGYHVRRLDFVIEGDIAPLVKACVKHLEATLVLEEEQTQTARLVLPGNVAVRITTAVQETYDRPGSEPTIRTSGIHDYLSHRDFSCYAIALSLNPQSYGLLLDPVNGQADLERREIRTSYSTALYDDPARLLRLIRLKHTFHMEVEEKTRRQLENVRMAGLDEAVRPSSLRQELRYMAEDRRPATLLSAIEEEGLLHLVSPALPGKPRDGLERLEEELTRLPDEVDIGGDRRALFLHYLLQPFSDREKKQFAERLEYSKKDIAQWAELRKRALAYEKVVAKAGGDRASIVETVADAPPEELLCLLVETQQPSVKERLQLYFDESLATSQEEQDKDLATQRREEQEAAIVPQFSVFADEAAPAQPTEPAPEVAAGSKAPAAAQPPVGAPVESVNLAAASVEVKAPGKKQAAKGEGTESASVPTVESKTDGVEPQDTAEAKPSSPKAAPAKKSKTAPAPVESAGEAEKPAMPASEEVKPTEKKKKAARPPVEAPQAPVLEAANPKVPDQEAKAPAKKARSAKKKAATPSEAPQAAQPIAASPPAKPSGGKKGKERSVDSPVELEAKVEEVAVAAKRDRSRKTKKKEQETPAASAPAPEDASGKPEGGKAPKAKKTAVATKTAAAGKKQSEASALPTNGNPEPKAAKPTSQKDTSSKKPRAKAAAIA